jgi:hypothetical protein
MLTMILKMTAATVIYVGATVLLWHFWHRQKNHSLGMKLAVGLFYGLCSVLSSHIGIDYGDMVLNVRDLGPLAAGLFFDPLSGILSGLIGGVERYIIGEYFGIGSFTRVACGVSTVLAGLLAAALNKWVYEGKRPSMIHCFFVGAEMEVFHMYAVFLTNREDLASASRVVQTCAIPMILFTALGLMACSQIILRLSGQRLKSFLSEPRKKTPIDLRFQRWMLLLVLVFLIFGSLLSYFQSVSSGGEPASGLKREFLETLFLEILIFTALYLVTTVLVNRIIVRNLDKVNDSLSRITSGHLTETVTVEESIEFAKLSDGINSTVTALRGYIDAAEKRMEEELALAAEIQDAALPKSFDLPAENIRLHALMTPARQVGGDFYDFFYTGPDQLALVIADVSGKGIPAALFMMRAKTAIKNSALSGAAPGKILETVNDILCEENEIMMFVTVWLGILDLKTGLMRCCNAGHEYPALMRAGGDFELLKDKHGLFLGARPGIPRCEYEIQLESGDRLFVYTDGVPEALNESAEQYGTARMIDHLNTLKDQPQDRLLSGMLENVRRFAGEAEQFDDITMLGITWTRPD